MMEDLRLVPCKKKLSKLILELWNKIGKINSAKRAKQEETEFNNLQWCRKYIFVEKLKTLNVVFMCPVIFRLSKGRISIYNNIKKYTLNCQESFSLILFLNFIEELCNTNIVPTSLQETFVNVIIYQVVSRIFPNIMKLLLTHDIIFDEYKSFTFSIFFFFFFRFSF